MASHYGSEHYCPLSLVRMYGTSELEVLDTDDDNEHGSAGHDQDNDSLQDDADSNVESQSPNLFGSAKDVVMSMVKNVAEAFTTDKNAQGTTLDNLTLANATNDVDPNVFLSHPPRNFTTDQCITIVQSISDEKHSEANDTNSTEKSIVRIDDVAVQQVLSCSFHLLNNLLTLPNIDNIVTSCSLCDKATNLTQNQSYAQGACLYLRAILGKVRFLALCYLYKLNHLSNATETRLETDAARLSSGSKLSSEAPLSKDLEMMITIFSGENKEKLQDATEKLQPFTSVLGFVPTETKSEASPETPQLDEAGPVVTSATLPNGIVNSSQSLQELIQPTKTLKPDEIGGPQANEISHEVSDSRKLPQVGSSKADVSDSESPVMHVPQENATVEVVESSSLVVEETELPTAEVPENPVVSENEDVSGKSNIPPVIGSETESLVEPSQTDAAVLAEITELNEGIGSASLPSSAASAPKVLVSSSGVINKTSAASASAQKESVFVRLSNRIKALELNMSLSSQYLEELSQRYRKQMEEMQKAFNKTIGALNETARKAQEQDIKQQEVINSLQAQIDNLSSIVEILKSDREWSGVQLMEPHVFIIFFQLIFAAFIFALFKRHAVRYLRSLNVEKENIVDGTLQLCNLKESEELSIRRRNSFAGQSTSSNKPQRRPSEEALNISTGTYADLMVVEPFIPVVLDQPAVKGGEGKKKRHRHKKTNRESTSGTLIENISARSSNFTSCPAVKRKSVAKVPKTSGLLLSEKEHTNCSSFCKPNCQTWQMDAKEPSSSAIRSSSERTSGKAVGNYSNACCPLPTSFVSKASCNNLSCNRVASNGFLCNGYASRRKSGASEEKKEEEFSIKNKFLKLFWLAR